MNNPNIIFEIITHLPYRDIINYVLINKRTKEICLKDFLIQQLMEIKYKNRYIDPYYSKLKTFIEEIVTTEQLKASDRDFLIQYSRFEKHLKYREWILSCPLNINGHGLYRIDVKYDDMETEVRLDSWKGDYFTFIHKSKNDYRGLSNNQYIYAIDLYDKFIPRHYKGECWTRGYYFWPIY